MSVDFGSTGNLSIASVNYLTLDTAGRVLKPNQTAFSATSGNAAAVGADIIFGGVVFNIGSAYNIANGRFTAPVAGRYFVRFHQLAPNANAAEYRHSVYVNGAAYGGCNFIFVKAASTWYSMMAEGHLNLNANDYVTIRYVAGAGTMYTDSTFIQFSGHLIG